ncbi:25709_t:CDS:2, partial [Dentiscutata erythropus]
LVNSGIVVNEVWRFWNFVLWRCHYGDFGLSSFTVWFAEMSILVSFAETDMSLGIFVGAFVTCLDVIR